MLVVFYKRTYNVGFHRADVLGHCTIKNNSNNCNDLLTRIEAQSPSELLFHNLYGIYRLCSFYVFLLCWDWYFGVMLGYWYSASNGNMVFMFLLYIFPFTNKVDNTKMWDQTYFGFNQKKKCRLYHSRDWEAFYTMGDTRQRLGTNELLGI